MLKYVLLPLVMFNSALALAAQPCEFSKNTELSLTELGQLQLALGSDQLTLVGSDVNNISVTARLCASSAQRLAELSLDSKAQHGGTALLLLPEKRNNSVKTGTAGRNDYAWFDLTLSVPASVAVQLALGSGKADIRNIGKLNATVGSGQLSAGQISGELQVKLGSGSLNASQVADLQLTSVGAGNVQVQQVAQQVKLDTLGSGTVKLDTVQGNIIIGSIGSGTVTLTDINGNVSINGLGSGSINANNVSGDLQLLRKGSGKVNHSAVQGKVSLPQR